jgi:hypothetical protein
MSFGIKSHSILGHTNNLARSSNALMWMDIYSTFSHLDTGHTLGILIGCSIAAVLLAVNIENYYLAPIIGGMLTLYLFTSRDKSAYDLRLSISLCIAPTLAIAITFIYTNLNSGGYTYWRLLPYIDELLLDGIFHRDTLYHTSLIASIKTQSTPSTGIDHLTTTPYHILSHIFSAGLAKFINLDTFLAMPLLGVAQKFLFISVSSNILLMNYAEHRSSSIISLVLHTCCLALLLIVWPQSLFAENMVLTTYVTVVAVFYLVHIFKKQSFHLQSLSNRQLLVILLLIILISLSKISSGFIFAFIFGLLALFSMGFQKKVVGYAIISLVFFAIYYNIVFTQHANQEILTFKLSWDVISDRLIYMIAISSIALAIMRQWYFLVRFIFTCGILAIFLALLPNFVPHDADVTYFVIGTEQTIALFSLFLFVDTNEAQSKKNQVAEVFGPVILFSLIFFILATGNISNTFQNNKRISNVIFIDAVDKLNQTRSLHSPKNSNYRNSIRELKRNIDQYISSNNIDKKHAALYFYELDEFETILGGPYNNGLFSSMFMYVLTELPILRGLLKSVNSYGFSYYERAKSKFKKFSPLEIQALCKSYEINQIIYVSKISPFESTIIDCR